jgi:hypothetical protein
LRRTKLLEPPLAAAAVTRCPPLLELPFTAAGAKEECPEAAGVEGVEGRSGVGGLFQVGDLAVEEQHVATAHVTSKESRS